MAVELKRNEKRQEPRVLRELPIRRLNVDIAGLVIHTSNVSRGGAQLVCPVMRFPALKVQLAKKPLLLAIELPTGRVLNAVTSVRYSCPCDDEYLIGVAFESFHDGDAAGWFSYIDWITDPRR